MRSQQELLQFIRVVLLLIVAWLSGPWVLPSGSLWAQSPGGRIGEKQMAGHIAIMEEPDGPLSIEEVRRLDREGHFHKLKDDNTSLGFVKSAYWIRFTYDPSLKENSMPDEYPVLHYRFPTMDRVDFYRPGQTEPVSTGDSLPFSSREIDKRQFGFFLIANAPEQHSPGKASVFSSRESETPTRATYYMRLETYGGSMNTSTRIVPYSEFISSASQEDFFYGMLFGTLSILALYNLVIFAVLRDPSYLYYVLFLLGVILYVASLKSFAYQYVWPNAPYLNYYGLDLGSGLSQLSIMLFTRRFLHAHIILPRLYRVSHVLVIGSIAYVVISFIETSWTREMSVIHPLLIIILGLAMVLRAVQKGYRPARIYLLAVMGFVLGLLLHLSMIVGYRPFGLHFEYGTETGLVLMSTLFSLGLAERVNQMREERNRAENKLVRIHTEMDAARKIQESILPETSGQCDRHDSRLEICSKYLPMREVGGDFYDIERIDDHRWAILMADVAGHGMGAALVAVMVKNSFWMQKENLSHPSTVLAGMNRFLSEHLISGFVTAQYLYVDTEQRYFRLSSSGHNAMLLLRTNSSELEHLKPAGKPLGILGDQVPGEMEVNINPGDRIILYTDGLIEARNRRGQDFESEFYSLIMKLRHKSGHKFMEELMDKLYEWSDMNDQEDDISLIVVDLPLNSNETPMINMSYSSQHTV